MIDLLEEGSWFLGAPALDAMMFQQAPFSQLPVSRIESRRIQSEFLASRDGSDSGPSSDLTDLKMRQALMLFSITTDGWVFKHENTKSTQDTSLRLIPARLE